MRACFVSHGTISGVIINTDQGYKPAFDNHVRSSGDRLVLTTVVGATGLLAEDIRAVGLTQVTSTSEDSVICRFDGDIAALRGITTYRTAGIVLDDAPSALPNLSAVRASIDHGVLAMLDLDSPLRYRVGGVGVQDRRAVIKAILMETDWVNAPGDWHINLTRRRGCWIAEVGPLHYSRHLGPLRRQPWSTNPVLAAILIRIAKINSGQTVHDPFCGTGTVLIAAHRAGSAVHLTGTDHDHQTLEMARANLTDYAVVASLVETDAIPFPHPDQSVHRIVSNLPFGKQVGSHVANTSLYPALIDEVGRTLHPAGRAVLLTDDKRLLVDTVDRMRGLKIIRERMLRYGGATPTAYTICRTRMTRQSRSPRRATSRRR